MLVLASCSSTPQFDSTLIASEKGVPGGVFVRTVKLTATVTAMDEVNRKLTLTGRHGKENTFKVGPEVVDFLLLNVGAKVKAVVTEEMVVSMANDAPPASQGAATTVTLRPAGARPGSLIADTVELKAKVTAIDLKHHKATLQFPDNSSHKVAVRDDVDLTQRKVGEEVIIRATESVAITVEKS